MKVRKPKPPTIVYNPEWAPEGRNASRYRWIENASTGLRVVGASHDILPRGRNSHTGWYADNFQDSTVHGVVLQLPARDGKPVYVPAYSGAWEDDCLTVDFHSTTDDKEEAARWADGMAECFAESARESEAKDQAEQQIEDARIEICGARKLASRLVADLRTAGHTLPPSVRDVVRSRIHALRCEVKRAHARITDLGDNYWRAVI